MDDQIAVNADNMPTNMLPDAKSLTKHINDLIHNFRFEDSTKSPLLSSWRVDDLVVTYNLGDGTEPVLNPSDFLGAITDVTNERTDKIFDIRFIAQDNRFPKSAIIHAIGTSDLVPTLSFTQWEESITLSIRMLPTKKGDEVEVEVLENDVAMFIGICEKLQLGIE